ncbi:MAG: nucleotidyltransferase family protein [Bacteroidota bacterium]
MQATQDEYQLMQYLLRCDEKLNFERFNSQVIVDALNRHRLFSLLDKCRFSMEIKGVLEFWRNEYRLHTSKSIHLAGGLCDLLKFLKRKQIETISIKGPVLAQSLFGDVGKRHFGDLDLVVQKEDVHRVVAILEGMGYKMTSPKPGLGEKQWDYYFKYKKDVGLVNREKGVFIELHVGVYRHELLREADEGMMWEDLEEVMIGGTPVKTMNKDNTFLYLLYHGGQHLYFRLFWLRDVAEAMKRWELNHNEILEKAKFLGIERMVGMGLLVAKEFFGIEIPPAYENYISENHRILERLKQICIKRIQGPEHDTLPMRLSRHRFNLMLKPGLKYKWAVITSIYHRWYIRKYLGGH